MARGRTRARRQGWAVVAAAAALALVAAFPGRASAFPVTTIRGVPDGWSSSAAIISLVPTPPEEAVSFYTLRGGPTMLYAAPFAVSYEGTTTIVYWSRDGHTAMEEPKSATVLIDKTPPTCALSGVPTVWAPAGIASLRLSARDALAGVSVLRYRLNGGPVCEVAADAVTVDALTGGWIEYEAIDGAGNVSPPASVALPGGPGPITRPTGVPIAWSRVPVTVGLEATSPVPGACATYVSVGASPETPYTAPVVVSVEGTTQVSFRSSDAQGRPEEPRSTTVRIDRTAPVVSASGIPSEVSSRPVSVRLVASDSVSGVAGIRIRVGDGAPSTSSGNVVLGAASGEVRLEWWAVDVAGNEGTHDSVSLHFDTLAPVTACDAGGSYVGTAAVTLTAADNAGGTGVASTWWRLDGAAAVRGSALTVAATGTHTLEYWSVDALGNAETHRWAAFAVLPAPGGGSQPPTGSVPPTSSAPPTSAATPVGVPYAPALARPWRAFTLSGRIAPRVGSATTVRIVLERLERSGWRQRAVVRARVSQATGYTRFTAITVLAHRGRWRARAFIVRGGQRVYGGYRYFRVR